MLFFLGGFLGVFCGGGGGLRGIVCLFGLGVLGCFLGGLGGGGSAGIIPHGGPIELFVVPASVKYI